MVVSGSCPGRVSPLRGVELAGCLQPLPRPEDGVSNSGEALGKLGAVLDYPGALLGADVVQVDRSAHDESGDCSSVMT